MIGLLDLVLLVGLAIFAVAGYRQGFLVGAFGFAGFLAGGVLGLLVVPVLLPDEVGPVAAALAIAAVLLASAVGQFLAGLLGAVLRSRMRRPPARIADAAAGAVVSVCALLLVGWFLALAVVDGPFPSLSREVRDSRLINAVDSVMPDGARQLFSDFRSSVANSSFPEVFGELAPDSVPQVEQPDSELLREPAIEAARGSIVEIAGYAPSCREQLTGSGFVVSAERVITNAHVVAGVREPAVRVSGLGLGSTARVVHFDPALDVAVLHVPGLDAPPLEFAAEQGERGDDAVVAGFPGGREYTAVPARLREVQTARGRDIYGDEPVTREVYAVRAAVRPGHSGGPLLARDGTVLGVVFAASVDDPDTGFALTADQVADAVDIGRSADAEVGVGGCA